MKQNNPTDAEELSRLMDHPAAPESPFISGTAIPPAGARLGRDPLYLEKRVELSVCLEEKRRTGNAIRLAPPEDGKVVLSTRRTLPFGGPIPPFRVFFSGDARAIQELKIAVNQNA